MRIYGIATAGMCAGLLAACNAVSTSSDHTIVALPKPTVVLQGTIKGLGSQRSVTLVNNGDSQGAQGFIAADPVQATAGIPDTPFSFGAIPQGSPYAITVKGSPFGKICTVANGSGTITTAEDLAAHPITVNCANDPAVTRYDLTVSLPNDSTLFTGLPGATVNLKTEDQIYSKTVTSGQTSVTFPGALFNAAGQPSSFKWTVLANISEADGSQSKCVVTGPTGTNPTANVVTPRVGTAAAQTQPACKFTISGSVAYSTPPGGASAAMPAGGLTLEVRDVQGNVLATQNVADYGAFTFGGTATPSLFPSNSSAVYDIAVATPPTGQTCVVGDGGGVNFYTTGSNNPVSVTSAGTPVSVTVGTTSPSSGIALGSRLNVFCRATPAAGAALKGTYRLTSSTWIPNITAPVPVTSTYTPFDLTVQNTASSNMLTFFDDGTFLYATHAANTTQAAVGNPVLAPGQAFTAYPAVQVEHGFYDYDAATQKLRFTLVTDTNGGTTFPTNFAPTQSPPFFGASATLTTTNGLSATPGAVVIGAGVGSRSASMTNVAVNTGTPRTITGQFGGDANATTATNNRLNWTLTEPNSLDHEMTGTWISQDHRRFWVWDFANYYGYHVGVEGGASSVDDSCFTMEDLHASSGIYTRRGSISYCLPFSRISTAMFTAGTYGLGTNVESVDFNTATWVSPAITATGFVPLFTNTLPGFVGRLPGGQGAADGRSPSPNYFVIAPAATFFNTADPTYFPQHFPNASSPVTSLAWCTTEVLGIRATSNGLPIDHPVYFCRTRAP